MPLAEVPLQDPKVLAAVLAKTPKLSDPLRCSRWIQYGSCKIAYLGGVHLQRALQQRGSEASRRHGTATNSSDSSSSAPAPIPEHQVFANPAAVVDSADYVVLYEERPSHPNFIIFVTSDWPQLLSRRGCDWGSARYPVTASPGVLHKQAQLDDQAAESDLFVRAALDVVGTFQPIDQFSFPCIPSPAVSAVRTALAKQGYTLEHEEFCYRIHTQLQQADFDQVAAARSKAKVAEAEQELGLVLDSLQETDASLVDSTWAYRGPGTLSLVTALIRNNPSCCMRVKATGQAVAWVLQYHDGAIGMGYCLEPYRRRGLVQVCTSVLGRKILAEGQSEAFGFVVATNTASLNMLSALGFRVVGMASWLRFRRQVQQQVQQLGKL